MSKERKVEVEDQEGKRENMHVSSVIYIRMLALWVTGHFNQMGSAVPEPAVPSSAIPNVPTFHCISLS